MDGCGKSTQVVALLGLIENVKFHKFFRVASVSNKLIFAVIALPTVGLLWSPCIYTPVWREVRNVWTQEYPHDEHKTEPVAQLHAYNGRHQREGIYYNALYRWSKCDVDEWSA